MPVTSFVIISFLVVAVSTVALLMRNPLATKVTTSKIAEKLKGADWVQNHWKAGLFLFGINAGLFFFTGFLLYLLMYFLVPLFHITIMVVAVVVSLLFWSVAGASWKGTKGNRIKASAVGSSFYALLALGFVYMLMTLQPAYPGEDTFMRAIGVMFGIIVAVTAFVSCFLITGFAAGRKTNSL
ncbi:hypothetical protein [Aneurinibacillus uraniidurans]|uniref:hypothetical protein n=1 Tax=Aneurinibacillus uraniidurans TaxID=2966586 RepID=UPI00234B59E6|nr:hypothetical protein [Aneurinibacillus sp. B1]WCN38804.1 hypothetical protein PO771_05205 [Aneurinibacillus sp. B1]